MGTPIGNDPYVRMINTDPRCPETENGKPTTNNITEKAAPPNPPTDPLFGWHAAVRTSLENECLHQRYSDQQLLPSASRGRSTPASDKQWRSRQRVLQRCEIQNMAFLATQTASAPILGLARLAGGERQRPATEEETAETSYHTRPRTLFHAISRSSPLPLSLSPSPFLSLP